MNFIVIFILLILPIKAKYVAVCKQSQIDLNDQLIISTQLVCPINAFQLSTEELCDNNKECINYIKEILDQIPICFHDKRNLHEDAINLLKKCDTSIPSNSIPITNSVNAIYTNNIILLFIYILYLIQVYLEF